MKIFIGTLKEIGEDLRHYHASAVFSYGKNSSTLLPLGEYLQFSLLISFPAQDIRLVCRLGFLEKGGVQVNPYPQIK